MDKKGWPCHSSQKGLIEELLEAGVTVQLTFEVQPVVDMNKVMDAKLAAKQRI
jgi:hypothetical protein